MFTWNFQYVSKSRLAETFGQLLLNAQKGDVLIRIHTAIHTEEEAVELARFIKGLVPRAQIFGTSTSAVINRGKLSPNQCVISVTQMDQGSIRTVMLPTFEKGNDPDGPEQPLPVDTLCGQVKNAVVSQDTKLMLTFLTAKYLDVHRFVERCNDYFPQVQMIGGLANTPEYSLRRFLDTGFVFNETGWSNRAILAAAFSGEALDSFSSCATGVQVIGEDMEITETDGASILSLDGADAAQIFRTGVGDEILEKPELANLFPFVYSDMSDIPMMVRFSEDHKICANHNVQEGKKLRRAFIYDGKIIADNRALFRRVENFAKAETVFGYSCIARSVIYSNCVKWELSAYENSNMCGCITEGEIAHVDGRNTFANCSFVVSVMGETEATQDYNPYVFYHTDSLGADNHKLLQYLMDIERREEQAATNELKAFVQACEKKLLYVEKEELPNAAAMNMDINLKGYDRICMINVAGTSGMKTVFPERLIQMTYRNYVTKCADFARNRGYRVYVLDKWHTAIGAPSYMVELSRFVRDMEILQKELFSVSEEYIAIVPIFCVIDACTVENLNATYSAAQMEMMNQNIQFYVRDAAAYELDADSIRERYRMINVINYAIEHDKVIPYFQGIYDNHEKRIHHYESLMRLKDENGILYYPNNFLDVARSFGLLYDSISMIMIRKVFEKFRDSVDESVSMNLGIRDIKNTELTEYIYDFLSQAEHPENFVFEILENEDVGDYDILVKFVDKIHELGGLISIDDFGSGYSNLQHIMSIHSDFIKIDGSIVQKCCESKESENLIALICNWKKLSDNQIRIIAEYVENEEIQKKLEEYQVDFSQGYLFSRPAAEIIS